MIAFWGFLGLLTSVYAIYVEKRATSKAYCDIKEGMSCSRVLKSRYAKMLGLTFGLGPKHPLNISNAHFGLLFYCLVVLYPFVFVPFKEGFLLAASTGAMLASCGLAYILMVKLHDLCLVCVATYAWNAAIWICALQANGIL